MRIRRCTPLSPGEQSVSVFAFDAHGGGFEARAFAGRRVDDRGAESLAFSAQRRYMRSSISAQSCDSVPPAPGLMVMMAFRRSFSPESSVSVSSSAMYVSAESISRSMSCRTDSRWAASVSSCGQVEIGFDVAGNASELFFRGDAAFGAACAAAECPGLFPGPAKRRGR